jgi:hypothetical protein
MGLKGGYVIGSFSIYTHGFSVLCVPTCLTLTHESLRMLSQNVCILQSPVLGEEEDALCPKGGRSLPFTVMAFVCSNLPCTYLQVSHIVCVCVCVLQFPLTLKYLDGEMVKWFKAELGSSLFLCRTSGFSFNKGCVERYALPFTLKSILRQKKNYGNSNISPCKYITLKKSSKKNQNLSHSNYITNLKFQHKPKYHLSKILT